MKKITTALLIILLLGVSPMSAQAQTENCILIMTTPLIVELCHDGTVVDVIEGEWGPENVYEIELIKFTNPTGAPWRLQAENPITDDIIWITVLAANSDGERNVPPPERFNSTPLRFRMTLVRN